MLWLREPAFLVYQAELERSRCCKFTGGKVVGTGANLIGRHSSVIDRDQETLREWEGKLGLLRLHGSRSPLRADSHAQSNASSLFLEAAVRGGTVNVLREPALSVLVLTCTFVLSTRHDAFQLHMVVAQIHLGH